MYDPDELYRRGDRLLVDIEASRNHDANLLEDRKERKLQEAAVYMTSAVMALREAANN